MQSSQKWIAHRLTWESRSVRTERFSKTVSRQPFAAAAATTASNTTNNYNQLIDPEKEIQSNKNYRKDSQNLSPFYPLFFRGRFDPGELNTVWIGYSS